MCGICGFAPTAPMHEENQRLAVKEFFSAWTETDLYGGDAAGMFMIGTRGEGRGFTLKSPGVSTRLAPAVRARLDQSMTDTSLLVAHCRKATSGGPNDNKNNHPFVIDGLVGVHNGIFTDHRKYAQAVKPTGNCDSEVLFRLLLLLEGIKPFETVLNSINNYNRVVFWKDGVLYAYTGDGDGMYLARDPELGVIWFGTDPECFHKRLGDLWHPLPARTLMPVLEWDPPKTRSYRRYHRKPYVYLGGDDDFAYGDFNTYPVKSQRGATTAAPKLAKGSE